MTFAYIHSSTLSFTFSNTFTISYPLTYSETPKSTGVSSFPRIGLAKGSTVIGVTRYWRGSVIGTSTKIGTGTFIGIRISLVYSVIYSARG